LSDWRDKSKDGSPSGEGAELQLSDRKTGGTEPVKPPDAAPIHNPLQQHSPSQQMDGPSIWKKVQTDLRARLGDRVHSSWTGQLSLAVVDDNKILLTTQSRFVSGRIENRYGELVKTLWAQYDSRDVQIGIMSAAAAAKPQTLAPAAQNPLSTQQNTSPRPSAPSKSHKDLSRFRFDNFVVGPSNEFAFAAARTIASGRPCSYNPIVIHGPHGMGKTHLLQATVEAALARDPSLKVKLISSESFVASFVQSVRAQGRSEIEAFKSRLRDVDILIIDDAHFIADKPGSQEELLHTLISLVDAGKQILIATDRHPHAIAKASDRLKSYLCGGLLCGIDAADFDLRRKILDGLIERRNREGQTALNMPQNARDHLAARINATPRDLEGAFNQIVARLEFLGQPLSLESVQEALAHSRYMGNTTPSVDKIQRATVKQFGISMDEILSKRRSRAIARPRQVAMYVCKIMTRRSLPDIGRRFGGRDHTTVIHAVKRIEALRAEDSALNAHIETLMETLKSS